MILEHLRETAKRAHSWTSFDPEKRAESIVRGYSEELTEDLKTIKELNGDLERYQTKYEELLKSWLISRSNCASTMITGGSNFNVRRNEKANNAADNKYNLFVDWRDKALKAIKKNFNDNKSPEQKHDELWVQVEKKILSSCAVIIAINEGTERGYNKALFVSSVAGTIKTHAKNGRIDIVKRCLDLITRLNDTNKKPVISSRNSIWKLVEAAEQNSEAAKPENKPENKSYPMPGGEIILNYEIDRIQVRNDEKPEREVIAKYKKNGLRWSPSQGVWQRQLTRNAIWTINKLFDINI